MSIPNKENITAISFLISFNFLINICIIKVVSNFFFVKLLAIIPHLTTIYNAQRNQYIHFQNLQNQWCTYTEETKHYDITVEKWQLLLHSIWACQVERSISRHADLEYIILIRWMLLLLSAREKRIYVGFLSLAYMWHKVMSMGNPKRIDFPTQS